jgi:transmembrane sensor
MEQQSQTDDERACDEATEWMILLQDRPRDEALRGRFEAWRSAAPINEAAWSETCRFARVASTLEPAEASEWTPFVASRRRQQAPKVRFLNVASSGRAWLIPGLSLAAAACLLFLFGPALLLRVQADYVTGTAEQREVGLPDGSRITLAPGSAIGIAFDAGERRIHLLAGEAFFDVRSDPRQPFRVTARGMDTIVLGTRFDVRLGSEDVTVSVEEGMVRVANSKDINERLSAGQSVRIAENGMVFRTEESVELVAAWRKGQLYAHGLTLRTAVEQLRQYYSGTILIADSRLARLRVTGAYNLNDPEEALRGMAQAHGALVWRITPWLLVVSGP